MLVALNLSLNFKCWAWSEDRGNWLSWGPHRVHNTLQWVRNPALEVFATVHGAIFNTGESELLRSQVIHLFWNYKKVPSLALSWTPFSKYLLKTVC